METPLPPSQWNNLSVQCPLAHLKCSVELQLQIPSSPPSLQCAMPAKAINQSKPKLLIKTQTTQKKGISKKKLIENFIAEHMSLFRTAN